MTATMQKAIVHAPPDESFAVASGTENPVSADEMERRRDQWLERNKHLLVGYSSDKFIAQKRRDVEAGQE